MRIKKYLLGKILYPGLGNLSMKWEDIVTLKMFPVKSLTNYPSTPKKPNQVVAAGTSAATNYATDKVTNNLFDDSELGRGLGTLFSSGVSSAGNTLSDNLLKGTTLTEGLGINTGASVAGAGAGLAANYLGQGINSLGGNTMLSRGIGQGVATGLGTVGGAAMSNLVLYGTLAGKSANGVKTALIGKAAGAINPYALAMNVVGSGLGAAFGPSKEYGGKYGNITLTMDTVYDTAMVGANFIPGAGQMISGVMALNKGLSNIFGSTDGMCVCAGTKIFTAEGDIKNIEDLILEDGIIGWNLKNHLILPNTIKGFIEPRLKECLEIELKNGTILRCSIDHPILSNNKPKAESLVKVGSGIAL